MWDLNNKKGWVLKNWCLQTVVLLPSNSKEIKPVKPKGNQPWIFTGTTDAEAEAPMFWPPDVKNWLIRKDPDAGKDWRQDEKGMTEDEMVGWHHQLDGHEFEQAPGDTNDTMHKIDGSYLMVQMVEKLPTMQETWVQSLVWEDPLEKGMAIHSSILAWKIPWTEEPGRLQSMGLQRVGHDWVTNMNMIN